ncbi:hypothetical protein ASE03_14145 [Kitasatospora sp. Root187]|nr:hypothetical protein ASE03_14145 [Kitasatospora sp. Root187]
MACTGRTSSTPSMPSTAVASRCAIALECEALRSQRSPLSRASNCTDTKRIFEASCIDILRRNLRFLTFSGLRTTTASPSSRPFFVPPNESTSTPASVVKARSGSPRAAAALAIREPSRCTSMPCSWAWSQIALISSAV